MPSFWYRTLLVLVCLHGGAAWVLPTTPRGRLGTPCAVPPVRTEPLVALAAAAPRSAESNNESTAQDGPLTLQESVKEFFVNLVRLSLQDYEWRNGIFRETEADRLMDDALARLQGQTDRPYLRPMDASEDKMGPLGRWEKSTVNWLRSVMDEEGRRAQQILSQQGRLVRPMEASSTASSRAKDAAAAAEDDESLGPLGFLEQQASDFIQRIRASEEARVRTKTLRPKDLEESVQGPLGRLESSVWRFWRELADSEKVRYEQSQRRGGEMVRPIDVPGPLGELELGIAELLRAEERRAMELNKNKGKLVRPKDARYQGPLGEIEQWWYDLLEELRMEEEERLKSIQQLMQEQRPMETNRKSALGVLESLVVGIFRAPAMLVSVVGRVGELLRSEPLPLPASDKDGLQPEEEQESSQSKKT